MVIQLHDPETVNCFSKVFYNIGKNRFFKIPLSSLRCFMKKCVCFSVLYDFEQISV